MALGRRREERQQEFWIATSDLPRSEGHVFYRKLNQLLSEAEFDPFIEQLCEPYYHEKAGRPGIPPGIYFRMLLVGYYEGLDWISALRSESIRKLTDSGNVDQSLFDERDLAEITSPEFPGERLIVCRNPFLADLATLTRNSVV